MNDPLPFETRLWNCPETIRDLLRPRRVSQPLLLHIVIPVLLPLHILLRLLLFLPLLALFLQLYLCIQ